MVLSRDMERILHAIIWVGWAHGLAILGAWPRHIGRVASLYPNFKRHTEMYGSFADRSPQRILQKNLVYRILCGNRNGCWLPPVLDRIVLLQDHQHRLSARHELH